MLRRLRTYLYSTRNLVASALAIGGLALHFVGLVGDPLWLPIVIGLYAIGALLTPGERALDLRLDAAADAAELRGGLERLLRTVKSRATPDIYRLVASIKDSILLTIPADGSGTDTTDPNVYLIRQTALDYLPAALESYLALPASYADRPILADGRTPHAALLDQLTLMDRKMGEVADDIVREDSERLVAHGRFLAEKFSASALDITAAPAAAASVPSPAAAPAETPRTEEGARAASPAAERERVR